MNRGLWLHDFNWLLLSMRLALVSMDDWQIGLGCRTAQSVVLFLHLQYGLVEVALLRLDVDVTELSEQLVLEGVVFDLFHGVQVDRVVVRAELLPLEELDRGLV